MAYDWGGLGRLLELLEHVLVFLAESVESILIVVPYPDHLQCIQQHLLCLLHTYGLLQLLLHTILLVSRSDTLLLHTLHRTLQLQDLLRLLGLPEEDIVVFE